MADQVGTALRRHAVQQDVHVVEALAVRRDPVDCVAQLDPACRVRQPPPGEAGRPFAQPTCKECRVRGDRLGEVMAGRPSRLPAAAEPGAFLRSLAAQVRPFEGAHVAGVKGPFVQRPVGRSRGGYRPGQDPAGRWRAARWRPALRSRKLRPAIACGRSPR